MKLCHWHERLKGLFPQVIYRLKRRSKYKKVKHISLKIVIHRLSEHREVVRSHVLDWICLCIMFKREMDGDDIQGCRKMQIWFTSFKKKLYWTSFYSQASVAFMSVFAFLFWKASQTKLLKRDVWNHDLTAPFVQRLIVIMSKRNKKINQNLFHIFLREKLMLWHTSPDPISRRDML